MKFEKLGNIAEIIAGQSPPSSSYNKNGDGFPFFQGKTDYGKINPVTRIWCNQPTKISLPGDILISVRAPVGPVNINNVKACIGRGLSAIRVKNNISRDYVFYFLKTNEKKISKLGVGSTFTAITQKDLQKIIIPIQPYTDQLLIANILSQAENLITQRKESIRLLDEFLKSTFLEMFGDPVYGEKYIRKTFGEISSVRQGLQIPIALRKTEPGINRYAYITNQFLNGGKIAEFIENPRPNVVCRKDDILMTRTGNTGIVLSDVEGVFHNNFFLIDYDRSIINRLYLVHFLKLPQIKAIVLKKASTTTIPDLNHGDFYKITIPLPPFDLQTKFAQIVESTEVIKTQYQSSLQELERLYGSLSQGAFKGELRAKDGEMMMAAEAKVTYQNKTNF